MRSSFVLAAALVLVATPLAAPERAAGALLVSAVTPVRYVSQLTEPAPGWWRYVGTPYCSAAAALMVMSAFGVPAPSQPLVTTFAIGRSGNTTNDPGIDPDGLAHLMRSFGGSGTIHVHRDRWSAFDDLIGRMNSGAPVVVLTQAGAHAVVAYGYEALAGGPVTAIYVADPLSGHNGKVAADDFMGTWTWWGAGFTAPGEQWRGSRVFVTYHDFRAAPEVVAGVVAPPPPAPVVAAPPPPVHASRFVSMGPEPVVAVGAVADVFVFVRNAGTVAWVRGSATEARLGVKGDDTSFHESGGAVEWPFPSRPAVQQQPEVGPGEVATFSFRVRGTSSGASLLLLRPVIDGLAWLNDDGIRVVVTVR